MLVHKESRSLLLRVKDPSAITKIIPKHKLVDIEGHNIAVRHGVDEVKVLRNLGIQAPSPILHHYNWPAPPGWTVLAHQKDTSANLTLERRMFVLNETGTMKTSSALWAADYLMSQGLIRKVIIAAKLSTLHAVWVKEIFAVLMHRNCAVLHGTKEKRLQRFTSDVDFYIINHEGLAVMSKEIMARDDIDLIICDEYSEYRNHQTSMYETLAKLLKPSMRFWGMTATPCPNAPTDAYALTKLISPDRVPRYFGQFKRDTMTQITQYKWVPKPEAYDIAFNAMQPAVRYRKADCLDLPPVVTEERTCELSAEQKKAYDRMRIDLVAEASKGVKITAVNAADKVNKLRQILAGSIKNGDGEYMPIDHAPRLKVLLECIAEAAAKVLVIIPFKGILQMLEQEVGKHYTCGVLNGDVSAKNRNVVIEAFRTQIDPHVLLCHPEVMAHGLTLTEADMVIFYAPIYSSDQFAQVTERINRPGQTRKMTVIRMYAAGIRLEQDIYAALDKKQDGQATILDMYRRVVS